MESRIDSLHARLPPFRKAARRLAYFALVGVAWGSVCTFFAWSVGAIHYLTFLPQSLATLLAFSYVAVAVFAFFRIKRRQRWLSWIAFSIVCVYLVTCVQQPQVDRQWDPSQSQATQVHQQGDQVTIGGFRHCVYRSETDFDVHYRRLVFNRSELKSVWFLVQKFSALEGLAHTFISFELDTPAGPEFFSVSVEIRREVGEVYSPIRGLYRQYELLYVVGDERDLIGSRTVMRPEDRVYMYRVNATREQVQQLFDDVAMRINSLKQHPEFYHTLLNNCTNGIVFHTYDLTAEPINWLDPRIVLPGYSDRFAFSQQLIGQSHQTFDDLQAQSRIDVRARQVGLTDRFSIDIRTP